MKAKHLIESASYGPEALKIVWRAFDEAWASIAGNFGNDPAAIEAARLKLAKIILSFPAQRDQRRRADQDLLASDHGAAIESTADLILGLTCSRSVSRRLTAQLTPYLALTGNSSRHSIPFAVQAAPGPAGRVEPTCRLELTTKPLCSRICGSSAFVHGGYHDTAPRPAESRPFEESRRRTCSLATRVLTQRRWCAFEMPCPLRPARTTRQSQTSACGSTTRNRAWRASTALLPGRT